MPNTIFQPAAAWCALLLIGLPFISCKKYLDARQDKSLVIPRKVSELQRLLDHPINIADYPTAGAIACDDVYYTDDLYSSIFDLNGRKIYIWDPTADLDMDWTNNYIGVSYANTVLNAIEKLNDTEATVAEIDLLKGSALFYRATRFYELAQLFAPPYATVSASTTLGIPLKTSPDVEDPTVRSTVQETYDQILRDLKEAIPLLPDTATYKTRPCKAAAFGELARTYLVMRNYDSAYVYANRYLSLYSRLMDYNDASEVNLSDASISFKEVNREVVYHAVSGFDYTLYDARVNQELVDSYDQNDLRKQAFFYLLTDGTSYFKGHYSATSGVPLFSGLATNEMYLIRAECSARLNRLTEAMDYLNQLLRNRWLTGTFVPLQASTTEEALDIILRERRKELVFRPGIRWSDLRRLNLEPALARDLHRTVNGQVYTLPANDLRYTFLIPQRVITIAGIAQNPR